MSNPVAKYRLLELFNGAIKLPLKIYKYDEPMNESALHYGYEGKRLNMIYVKSKEGIKKVASPDDIEVVVPFNKIQKVIEDSDGIRNVDDIPELVELLDSYNSKKSDQQMEILGIFPMNELPTHKISGDQFFLFTGEKGSKTICPKNQQVLQYLVQYLSNNKLYIHVKFFWSCPTVQKIGAIYEVDGVLRMSGLFSDIEVRSIKNPGIELKEDEKVKALMFQKLGSFYQKPLKTHTELYEIEWYKAYIEAFNAKGKGQKKIETIQKNVGNVSDNLLDILQQV